MSGLPRQTWSVTCRRELVPAILGARDDDLYDGKKPPDGPQLFPVLPPKKKQGEMRLSRLKPLQVSPPVHFRSGSQESSLSCLFSQRRRSLGVCLGRIADSVQETPTDLVGTGLPMHETVVHEGGGETLGQSLDGSRLRAINTQKRRWMTGLAIRALLIVLSLGWCRDQRRDASTVLISFADSSTSPSRPNS